MNVREYIESGILEEYVVGSASEQERQEVECMLRVYPEINEELNKLSKTLEQFAMLHQQAPPAHLRDRVLAAIAATEADEAGRVVPMDTTTSGTPPQKNDYFKWVAAAAIALLLVTVALYQNVKTQLSDKSMQLSTVSGKSELTADQLKNIKTDYIQLANQVSIMSHCDMKVKMEAGSECKQSCCLMIYCDGKKQEMYVQVNKLKPAPEGDLYQLWAVVDDKPVDMGRVEIPNDSLALKPVKFVHHAQAFVLTLEENGYDTVIHEDEILAQVSMDHQGM